MLYCDKCGHLWQETIGRKIEDEECDICQNQLKKVPFEYFQDNEFNAKWQGAISNEMQQKLISDLVFTSPNFDQYYFDHKDEIKEQQDIQYRTAIEHGKAILEGTDKGNSYGITCPYCKATNVRKIGIVSRSISTGLFGLGSKKIGKQWHCDHCGSDF